MTDTQFDLLRNRTNLVAVVGATDTPGKYGGIIYRDLKARGHRVVAVNPNRSTVAGDPSYPDLESLPERPAIVNLVVPPTVGAKVVDEWGRLEGNSVWLQPGAYDGPLLDRIQAMRMDVVEGDCIMVVSRRLAS